MIAQSQASIYVNGAYVEDGTGQRLGVIYPATSEAIARLHEASGQLIDQTITHALTAQKAWAAQSGKARGLILRRAADIMRERNRELSVLETYDTGKPLQETLVADATSGADALVYFGGFAGSLNGENIQLGDDRVYTRREPLGLCVGIAVWNYPTQIPCRKAAPAPQARPSH